MMPRALRSLPIAIVLLACMQAVVFADYKEAFRQGLKSYRQKQYQQAIKFFREAIAENGRDSNENILISGGEFRPYRPNHWIIVSLYEMRKCDEGEQERVKAERLQVLRPTDAAELMKARSTFCPALGLAAKGPAPSAPDAGRAAAPPAAPPETPKAPAVNTALNDAVRRAEEAIGKAETAKRPVDALAGDATLTEAWRSNASLGNSARSADDTLGRARRELEDARKQSDVKKAEEATSDATKAASLFDTIKAEGDRVRAELTAPKPQPAPAVTPPTAPGVEAPGKSAGVPPAAAKTEPAGIPPDLLEAARLFSARQYRESADKLARVSVTGDLQLHAEALQAATLFSLYVTSGQRDAALKLEAERHVRTCRRLDPGFVPEQRLYSPRFITFYRSTR
jgi:tetratricopeptide (TPR) repeat protein